MHALVIQHIACEPPGVYEDVLTERGATIHRVELDEGEPLPDWREFSAIVAMGGPMSVNDEEELPWLRAEKAFIAEAVRAGLPAWGSSCSPQALAPRLSQAPRRRSACCPFSLRRLHRPTPCSQVFRVSCSLFNGMETRSRFLREQCCSRARRRTRTRRSAGGGAPTASSSTVELSREMAAEWTRVPAYTDALACLLAPGSATALVDELGARADELRAYGRQMFERWLDLVPVAEPTLDLASTPD
jgi:GMP synthase (glutamine-hydrolysing)